jgi:predicted CopG family antitoxin
MTPVARSAQAVYVACMATKTISVKLEAYERLRNARRRPSESFSDVILRAVWPEAPITGQELLELYAAEGPFLSDAALDRIEDAKAADAPPEDKWQTG